MRRFLPILLAFTLLTSLAACGAVPSTGSGGSASGSAASSAASSEPEEPQVEPYVISDPKVEPAGGEKDGVPYVAWDGVVEHLFFHPVIAYP